MTDKRTGKKVKRAATPAAQAGTGLASLPPAEAAAISKKKHK